MPAHSQKTPSPGGKVAVVTGAASGIGFAVAEHCAEIGMAVALADVEASALSAAADRLGAADHRIVLFAVDVRSQASMERFAATVEEQLGAVDVLCSCAGVAGALGMSWELPLAMWTWVLDTNLMGTVHAIRSFVPAMVERDRGAVINVSSIGGLLPLPASAPYSVSKFGIVALTEALAEELRMRGSKVSASVACLGEVRTRIADDIRNWPEDLGEVPTASDDSTLGELAREISAAIDAGRDPREVAKEIVSQAVEGRFWIHTHLEEQRAAIVERTQAITS
jgi:NAD(P)-dependent dehydrogenase (short-subunit alcohol dehydrogenase family)